MIPRRDFSGLDRLTLFLAAIQRAALIEVHRRRMMIAEAAIFGAMFLGIVTAETLFAMLLFSIIAVEVLGVSVSGAAFALMVPSVIGMVHVKLHHESDHFTRWWLSTLSGIGIPIFCLGISLSLGFAAWQAAEDAVGAISNGPSGMIGNQQIETAPSTSTGIADWLSVIPNALLFLGLSFGMIIAIALASHCLGRALVAFNVLTQTPRIGPWVRETVAEILKDVTELNAANNADSAARAALPLDIKLRFANKGAHECRKIGLRKLDAARRKFAPGRIGDPLAAAFHDVEAETIPSKFSTETAFKRHISDVLDATRVHNMLAQVGGLNVEKE